MTYNPPSSVDQSSDKKLLLIETSGRIGRVGLAIGPNLLAERALDETRRHARDLAPAVSDLLREHSTKSRDLAAVFVSLGPGSYTGLRVGVMAAKSLAYAVGCAAIGIPTFQVLARQVDVPGLELVVVGDTQQEKLYVQRFARNSTSEPFLPANELAVVAGREWAREQRGKTVVVGPGFGMVREWLPPELGMPPSGGQEPTITGLLAVGWEWYQRGVHDDPLQLEPLYQRRSSAEEQWDRRASAEPC
jgi:tRNA threonylcarbamoyladenosine biosynthesis protein TsaB